MTPTQSSTDERHPHYSYLGTGWKPIEAVTRVRNVPRRGLGRTVGFWLGGALLGVGGGILGACLPYRHPVAVTISVLWWGIYLGWLGASMGALLGLWAEQTAIQAGERWHRGTRAPRSSGRS
jgi:hypothetical protein